ncbi:MAG: XrtA/PEP-CTERM system exopolysaccharide export protein [Steroidobacteraceae bacterium]
MRSAVAAAFILLAASGASAAEPRPEGPPSSESASSYVIGPGDTLDVFVWRNDNLSTRIPVRPDGRISTPLVEDMVAVGKTPTQLARDMERVLSEFIRSPKVNIIVTQAASINSRVRVVGQAVTPRSLPYREGLTILDAVIEVGGLSEFSAGNRAKLVRKEADGKTTEKRVRLRDLLEKGDMKQNLPMKPGDVLVIPESKF